MSNKVLNRNLINVIFININYLIRFELEIINRRNKRKVNKLIKINYSLMINTLNNYFF